MLRGTLPAGPGCAGPSIDRGEGCRTTPDVLPESVLETTRKEVQSTQNLWHILNKPCCTPCSLLVSGAGGKGEPLRVRKIPGTYPGDRGRTGLSCRPHRQGS
jgi:hypothetical protein